MTRTPKDEASKTVDIFVGQKLRAARGRYGLSMNDVAKELGITHQQFQKYESGANRISASTLWHLGNILQVDPGYFFEGLDGPDRESKSSVDANAAKAVGTALAEMRDLPTSHQRFAACMFRDIVRHTAARATPGSAAT